MWSSGTELDSSEPDHVRHPHLNLLRTFIVLFTAGCGTESSHVPVYWCVPVCTQMCTYVYWCVLVCTGVYTDVYSVSKCLLRLSNLLNHRQLRCETLKTTKPNESSNCSRKESLRSGDQTLSRGSSLSKENSQNQKQTHKSSTVQQQTSFREPDQREEKTTCWSPEIWFDQWSELVLLQSVIWHRNTWTRENTLSVCPGLYFLVQIR